MRIKNKNMVRVIGGLGVAITTACLLIKAWHCLHSPMHERLDLTLLLGLIVGFSLIHSAVSIELRNKIEALEKRR